MTSLQKVALVVALATLAAQARNFSPRISNGADAPQGKYPQTVSLQYQRNHICGATILNENWALTAAGCINGPSFHLFAEIYSGSVDLESGGTFHNTSEIIVHEDYSFFPEIYNDIALIRVTPPFDFSGGSKVAPVQLPEAGFDAEEGISGTIAGWGQPTPNLAMMQFMQEASYLTLSDSDDSCFPLLNDAATTFCAGNTGLGIGNCYGDNGDPLLVDGVQLGIVSWSLACLQTNEPTVFTQVSAYIDWINSRIN